MNRTEAETIHEGVRAMKQAEAFVEAIDEHRENTTTTEGLCDVLRDALNDDIPGDLFDTIEAIAMETMDRIRLAAITAARSAAADAGIHDYAPPSVDKVCDDGCAAEAAAAA